MSAPTTLTSLFQEELVGDDVLLASKLNGELLEEGLGAPVRLIVPSKYPYKSCTLGGAFEVYAGQRVRFLKAARQQ